MFRPIRYYRPFADLLKKISYTSSCPAKTAWLAGWLVKSETNKEFQHSNWKGYMKSP